MASVLSGNLADTERAFRQGRPTQDGQKSRARVVRAAGQQSAGAIYLPCRNEKRKNNEDLNENFINDRKE
jgi:hypothetical protein